MRSGSPVCGRSTSMSRQDSRSSCSWFAGAAPRLCCTTSRFGRGLGSSLTTAGMVAVVNSVVIGACAGLAVAVVPIGPLGVALAAGAIAGAATLSIQRRHQRQATDAYTPEGIDRAATFVPATEHKEQP